MSSKFEYTPKKYVSKPFALRKIHQTVPAGQT